MNVQPPTVVSAENVSAVVLDVPKNAVPVGTVAGFQLVAVLKSPDAGVGEPSRVLRPCRARRERRHRNQRRGRQQRGTSAIQPLPCNLGRGHPGITAPGRKCPKSRRR